MATICCNNAKELLLFLQNIEESGVDLSNVDLYKMYRVYGDDSDDYDQDEYIGEVCFNNDRNELVIS